MKNGQSECILREIYKKNNRRQMLMRNVFYYIFSMFFKKLDSRHGSNNWRLRGLEAVADNSRAQET